MIVWPQSSVPAGLKRTFRWGESENTFDSGAYQAMTPWSRPLYAYEVPYTNINVLKQDVLATFTHSVKGRTFPWLFKDPYEYYVDSVMAVRSGYASGSGTLSLYDIRSFFVRADTTTIGSLSSTLSGFVTLGAEFSYNVDSGLLTVNTKAVTDVWGARSMQYFRKCRFTAPYEDQGVVWQQFQLLLKFEEVV